VLQPLVERALHQASTTATTAAAVASKLCELGERYRRATLHRSEGTTRDAAAVQPQEVEQVGARPRRDEANKRGACVLGRHALADIMTKPIGRQRRRHKTHTME